MSYELNSSAIRRVSYDPSSGRFDVTFRQSGLTYTHHHLPADVFAEFMDASSKGGFYSRRIRGRYP
jgi:hypothetical protein